MASLGAESGRSVFEAAKKDNGHLGVVQKHHSNSLFVPDGVTAVTQD